jgi:hypothetical protein
MTNLPKALIVSTERWPSATWLGLALAQSDLFTVAAVTPVGHGIRKLERIAAHFTCNAHSGTPDCLLRAIAAWPPDIIVPCDELSLAWLRSLHARADTRRGDHWRTLKLLIERSLGDAGGFDITARKSVFVDLARSAGIAVPQTVVVGSLDELHARLASTAFPCVLKADGSFGGLAVRIVHSAAEADHAFAALTAPPSWAGAVRRGVQHATVKPLLDRMRAKPPTITLQQYIEGSPANRAVTCWQGDVLAGLSVEALETVHPTGPATVVRVIAHDEMAEVAVRIAAKLGLSGFHGFDFIIERDTGRAFLIEMNARPTQICHLALDKAGGMITALAGRLGGGLRRPVAPVSAGTVIALFPQELWRDPNSPYLRTAYHDVPWEHPHLVAAYLTPPVRSWMDLLVGWLQRAARRPKPDTAAAVRSVAQPLVTSKGR